MTALIYIGWPLLTVLPSMIPWRNFNIHGLFPFKKNGSLLRKKVNCIIQIFFKVRINGSLWNISLRNPNWFFYGITVKSPFWNLFFFLMTTDYIRFLFHLQRKKKQLIDCIFLRLNSGQDLTYFSHIHTSHIKLTVWHSLQTMLIMFFKERFLKMANHSVKSGTKIHTTLTLHTQWHSC